MRRIVVASLLIIAAAFLLLRDNLITPPGIVPQDKNSQKTENSVTGKNIEVLVTNLDIPWSLDFLPDGRGIVTQRAGSIKMLNKDGKLSNVIFSISEVKHIGEGGLLGIAVHPRFDENNFIFVYYTYSSSGDNTLNRVVRYKFKNETFSDKKIIIDEIPGGTNHNGGRLKFGPDGYLYVTTGDAGQPSLAQNKNSLAGKILRVDQDGKAAPENPFRNLIYSYGHRNPQGLAWNSQGMLYSTEHGPLAHDELNRAIPGGNYGWPTIQGSQKYNDMITPIKESSFGTWAPSGTAFYNDRLFFAGLRGTALFEAKIQNESIELQEHFKNEFGRIRDVVLGPDNYLYILTNNTDGRGRPSAADDKIIRINPESL